MRRLALVLVGALALACGPSVASDSREVHWADGLMIVVDAQLPTSIYARGVPRAVNRVGDKIVIVSWPADARVSNPERGRVAGRVVWSVAGRPDASEWIAVDDTVGILTLLEPAPPADPHTLRAELRPDYPRPENRISQ